MWGLLLLLGIGGLLFLALLVAQVMWTLTHPPRRTYSWAVSRGRPGDPSEMEPSRAFQTWVFEQTGGEVWDLEGDRLDGAVMIITHGWGDSRIGGLVRLEALAAGASRVVLWDLPGHGKTRGISSLGVRDVELLKSLIDRVGAERPVVLYGWSLGGGVSIAAAGNPKVIGVIAEAPYQVPLTPAWNVMRLNHLPHRVNLPIAMWLLGVAFGVGPSWRRGQGGIGFDRAKHAARLPCPLLVIHGTEDEICPFDDGRTIAHAAPDGELAAIEGAMHNNLWSEPVFAEQCADAVRGFLARLERPAASAVENRPR